ncbi:MAG: hypothetical protein J0I15_07125 [Herbaspirillum huttiense]|uniref:hypothetical protein n=1 Tax=Herbaspirillum huttiense TaxID=863372 RepID=UPI001ACE334B|nr:hypothetical protein [Herbaspirillum huttiense]MBN9356201.1 hypothetical protein [Herbaspirillum huttiense]
MSEIETSPKPHSLVKSRKCPGCGAVIERLTLSAFSMPVEQMTMPWLQAVNNSTGWSLRTFGQSHLNEPQFLCFTHICKECTLVSWWDVGIAELDYIIRTPDSPIGIGWTSSPENIRRFINLLPSNTRELDRESWESLLKSIAPGEEK